MERQFVKRTRIAAPADVVFDWHRRPEAFLELTPPWEHVELVERTGGIEQIGARLVIRVGRRPFRITWVAEHTHYEPGRMFRDVQIRGPFARWEHEHVVEPDGPHACWLEDRVTYRLPLAPLGDLVAGRFVHRKLQHLFDHRHRVTATTCTGDDRDRAPTSSPS